MSRDIKWEDWKVIDPAETMKIFCTMNKKYIVPGIEKVIEQDNNPTSDLEDPLPVNVIPDEG